RTADAIADRRRSGTCGYRARCNGYSSPSGRADSPPRCQHGELGPRIPAMLDKPADRHQASPRPPRADHVQVDVGAITGYDVAKVLLVPEREDGQVVQRVALARLGPVEEPGDLVTVDEDVRDLQVAVGEHRCPRPECPLGHPMVAPDHVAGK